MGEEPGADGSNSSSARHNRLLIEAELRAEHQAAARTTMLDLAHALDSSNSRARELASLLRNEYEISASLRHKLDKSEARAEYLEVEDEKRLARVLEDEALSRRPPNTMFFNMLLE